MISTANDQGVPQALAAFGASNYFLNNYGIAGKDWGVIYGYKFLIYGSGLSQQQTAKVLQTLGQNGALPMPLSPQNISIDVPAATDVAVTMKGIVENHNGAPLRYITIRGTTGVYPNAGAVTPPSAGPQNALSYLFNNTISPAVQAGKNLVATANTLGLSNLLGGNSLAPPLNYDVGSETVGQVSGYAWVHALIRFLDSYLELKKNKQYRGLRLQFLMYKDKMYYDCTLKNYRINKIPGTVEYEYEINLTAWRRTPNPGGPAQDVTARASQSLLQNPSQQINLLAQVVQGLRQSRILVSQSLSVLQGITADINQDLLTPMREAILLGSELAGATETILDFPTSIIQSSKDAILSTLSQWSTSATNPQGVANINNALAQSGINPTTPVRALTALRPGTTVQQTVTERQSLGTADLAPSPETSSPLEQIFQNPQAFASVFDSFTIDQLPLTPQLQQAVQAERARVQAFTTGDLIQARNSVRSFMYQVSLRFGGGDATYSQIFGLPPPPTVPTGTLDTDAIENLSQLNDIVMAFDNIIYYYQNLPTVPNNDYFSYYAALAQANGLTFNTSSSRFFVPMPAGGSLNSLALQYLGDSDRWIEIAALNGLQPPYIDETGFTVPLTTNASGSVITLASNQNLFVGQAVQISANGLPTVFTTIGSIKAITSIEYAVTLAYGTQLNGYTTERQASLFAYLPDTINYSSVVAIPSASPVNIPGYIQTSPTPTDLTYFNYMAKVDFLLTSSGDLAIQGGDMLTSSGLQNLIQAANLIVQTEVGSIISNPTYGNPAQAGVSVADVSASDIVQTLSSAFAADPRFGLVQVASAVIDGPAVNINILVPVAGTTVFLPIATQVPIA